MVEGARIEILSLNFWKNDHGVASGLQGEFVLPVPRERVRDFCLLTTCTTFTVWNQAFWSPLFLYLFPQLLSWQTFWCQEMIPAGPCPPGLSLLSAPAACGRERGDMPCPWAKYGFKRGWVLVLGRDIFHSDCQNKHL